MTESKTYRKRRDSCGVLTAYGEVMCHFEQCACCMHTFHSINMEGLARTLNNWTGQNSEQLSFRLQYPAMPRLCKL